jgi:hypothetical protein
MMLLLTEIITVVFPSTCSFSTSWIKKKGLCAGLAWTSGYLPLIVKAYGQFIQIILDVPVVLSFRIQNNKNGTSPFYKLLLCYHTCCTSFHSPQLSLKI